jgi:membrane protease YdiL (CAAX protease family)
VSQENPFLIVKVRTLILWFLLSILLLLMLSIIGGIFWGISVLFGNPDVQPADLQLSPLLGNILLNFWLYGTIVLWCVFQMRRSRLQFKALIGPLPRDRGQWRLLLLTAPILLFSLGAGQLLFYAIAQFAPDFATSMLQNQTLFHPTESIHSWAYNIFNLLILVIVAPLIEEFLFRGIILHRFSTRWSVTTGVILSSLLFGFLHLNPIGLSVFGVVTALLYLRTRALAIPILVHAINNGIVAVISWTTAQTDTAPVSLAEIRSISTLGSGLLLVALSLPWLIWYVRKTWVGAGESLPYWQNLNAAVVPPRSPEDVQV